MEDGMRFAGQLPQEPHSGSTSLIGKTTLTMETPINFVIGPRYHQNECFLLPTICLDFPEAGGLIVWADWTWFGLYFGMVDDETLKTFGD